MDDGAGRGEGKDWLIAPARVVQSSALLSFLLLVWYTFGHHEAIALPDAWTSIVNTIARDHVPRAVFLAALAGHAKAALVAAAVLLAAFLGGSPPVLWLGRSAETRWIAALSRLGLGLGVAALAVFALGLAGLLNAPMLAAAGLLAILAGLWTGRKSVKRAEGGGGMPWWPWAFASVLLVLGVMPCFSPEFFTDSLVYHLGLPGRFLAAHRFPVMPDNMLTFLPLNSEMLYAPCLAFGGEEAAKLFNFGLGVLAALAAGTLALSFGGSNGRWAAAAAFFLAVSMPLVMVENEITFSDNARAFWEVLALAWFVRSGGRANGSLLASGAFIGLAMGTKYLSYVCGFVLLAALVLTLLQRNKWRVSPALRAGAPFAAAMVLVVLPWVARNWLAGRDPLYPFGFRIFDALGFGSFEMKRWMADNRHYGVAGMTFSGWLALPLRVSLDRVAGEFGTYTTGPLLLGLSVLLVLRRSWPWGARVVLAVFAVEALTWSLTSQLIRYLYPGLLALCALVTWSAASARQSAPRSGPLLAAVLIAWGVCNTVQGIHHRINLDELYGLIAGFSGKFSGPSFQPCRGFAKSVAQLPSGPVLLVGEDRVLGLGRIWRGSSKWNVPLLERWTRESPDSRRLALKVRQSGVRSVLLNGEMYEHLRGRGDFNLSPERMAVLNAWWKTLGVVFKAPPLMGYAVPPFSPGLRRRVK